jgi:hypothetical protein
VRNQRNLAQKELLALEVVGAIRIASLTSLDAQDG